MEASSSALNSISTQKAGDAVGVSVLKKALDVQAQGAAALINALPQQANGSSSLPPHLGKNVNTTA